MNPTTEAGRIVASNYDIPESVVMVEQEAVTCALTDLRAAVEARAEQLGRRYQVIGQEWPRPTIDLPEVLALIDDAIAQKGAEK